MKKSLCFIICVATLLLSFSSSLKVRKANSLMEAAKLNLRQNGCLPGYKCLLKEETKNRRPLLQFYKLTGTGSKDSKKWQGGTNEVIKDTYVGSWELKLDQNLNGVGMAKLQDHDKLLHLYGLPAVNKEYQFSPDYSILGINENLQILFGSHFYYTGDDKVTGWGVLEESLLRPLFKLGIDCSSLQSEFYMDDAFFSRKFSLGAVEMKVDDSNNVQGTIKPQNDGSFGNPNCVFKFKYHGQGCPSDEFIVNKECSQSEDGEIDQNQLDNEGAEVNRGRNTNPELSQVHDKLMLKQDAKKLVLKMVKWNVNFNTRIYGLRADYE